MELIEIYKSLFQKYINLQYDYIKTLNVIVDLKTELQTIKDKQNKFYNHEK